MRRTSILLSTTLLVLAVAAAASTPVGAEAQPVRPHEAKATGTNTIDVDACTGAAVVVCPQETTTTLIATHLGLSSSDGTGQVTLDFGAPPCEDAAGNLGTPFVSVQHVVTVAANGDELYSDNVTTGCFVDFGVGTDPVGTYTITGGTGRFDGATGSGSLVAHVIDDALTSTWSGTIAY